jgi:hypothetical protein
VYHILPSLGLKIDAVPVRLNKSMGVFLDSVQLNSTIVTVPVDIGNLKAVC